MHHISNGRAKYFPALPRSWVRSPGRQGLSITLRQSTNSVGCKHAAVPSTLPRDPAAPSTDRLAHENGQRPMTRTADLVSPSDQPSTRAHTEGPCSEPWHAPLALLPLPFPPHGRPRPRPRAPSPQAHVHPHSCRCCSRRRGGPPRGGDSPAPPRPGVYHGDRDRGRQGRANHREVRG